MRFSSLRARLDADEFILSGWSQLADPMASELLLRASFDALILDMQHGMHDLASVACAVVRGAMLDKPVLARLPVGAWGTASKALDYGVAGLIAPMIDGPEDARKLVAAAKYPPLGERSAGPFRAADLHGYGSPQPYVTTANQSTLAFAMIETAAGVRSLDAILAVKGLDGVFVGPSDLSIAHSPEGTPDPTGQRNEERVQHIAAAAKRAGKPAAIYAITAEDARRYRSYGYSLVAVGSDAGLLRTAAKALAEAAGAPS